MTDPAAPPIPGVSDDHVAAVAGQTATLPNLHADRPHRFAQGVRALVEKRARQGWPGEGAEDVAIFALVDYPRDAGRSHNGTPFADPAGQSTPLLGHLFFSTPDATHGQFIPMPSEPNAILEWLEDHGFGDCPIVAVYRNAKLMVTRLLGVHDFAQSDSVRDKEPAATLEQLMDALHHYHRCYVVTPGRCPAGLWKPESAHLYIPGPRPERSIQTHLQPVLSSWFQGVVRVETEDTTNIGRLDVRLLTPAPDGRLAYWTILELKVVKSFTHTSSHVSDADNIGAIVKGIEQAAAFRANRIAQHGMLEVYDLRKHKSDDLTTHQPVTATRGSFSPPPDVHVWPVYGSAEDARHDRQTGF